MRLDLTDYLRGRPDPTSRVVRRLGVFCRLAHDLAGLSTCRRLQVGAVLLPPDLSGVVSIGYNGPAAGLPNDGCRGTEGGCGCIHSEANCLVKARRGVPRQVLLVTDSPCEHCAGLVLNAGGIAAVLYLRRYRDPAGLKALHAGGVWTESAVDLGAWVPL